MEKKFPDNAKPTLHLEVFNDDLESIMTFKNKSQEAAPTMYDMLLRRIPAHKLVLGQKVLGIKQGDNDAQVNTAQGYIESDIIVRADGAYISTRKRMYESMWTTYTTESNSICWNVMLTLNKETSKIHNTFLKCEWGTEDANSMVERVRGFRIPNGDGTKIMGDLISGMLAMQDAVALANWINVLPMNPKMERIEDIFSYFQKERKQYIDQGFEHSKANSRLTRGTVKGSLSRMMVNWLPTRILGKTALATVVNRPLVSFPPETEDNGFTPRDQQPSFEWTRFIMIPHSVMSAAESSLKRPKVIIIGAGLAGVVLGALLEKAGVDFDVYERAPIVKPLGSAMAFGCNVMDLFRQLGIEEEFLSHAKPTYTLEVYNPDKELLMHLDNLEQEEKGGSHMYIIARPIIYDMLLRLIPAKRLHFGKKILSTLSGENGVMIRTSDGNTYEGDILVGADGAYSSVRQSLYERLKKDGNLPKSDSEDLPFKYVSLVGQTMPLDPEEFPELKREDSPFQCTVGENRYSWITFTTKANTICYGAVLTLDKTTSKQNDSFRNSEWGPEAAEQMCKEIKDFPILNGDGTLTMNDLFERSPKHLISKVMVEEKIFKTWFSGRTVLLGDAVHKMSPAGGMGLHLLTTVGAVCAMQDAIVLANWINVLHQASTMEEVEKAFKEYRNERLPYVMKAYNHSQSNSHLIGSTLRGKATRWVVNHLPKSILDKSAVAHVGNRPRVAFLPIPPVRGSVKPDPQRSLTKTQAILAQQGRNAVVTV
ncbi:hypothetical protein CPC16_009452 [Podila verticillata]|nr:hypothetical protein CPC16_009452 [Podila verticillata]